ncbi:O-antigen ligase family protein [Anaerostipes sp.]|uniref:O-antigen ligase family protein n=1 Tax=Anaerostipes sp. TaxID=1872530 RepID=UPI0025BD93EE|nr:O-antigen ligase family protein [Anaerostipes sp.]MBS7007116.1 O-antigen ligase family protein [Anaerostipes sp.]
MISAVQKTTKNSDMVYKLLILQIILLFILPPLDGKINIIRVIIYAIFSFISIALVLIFVKKAFFERKIKVDLTFWSVMFFFGMCAVSAVWGISRGILLTDVVRGILPFVWFIYIIVLTQSLTSVHLEKIIRVIGVLAVFYAARIIIYYFIYVFGNPYERVTFHLVKATSIMPMIGSLILGYYFIQRRTKNLRYFVGFLVCYITVLLTETKAMLIALVIGWIILEICIACYIRKQKTDKNKLIGKMFIICCSLFICTGIMMLGSNLGKRWESMIAVKEVKEKNEEGIEETEKKVIVDQGSVSVRIIEIKTALQKFKESPVLGQGIGYRWIAKGIDYGEPVIYMHNILAFVVMDFGIIGLIYVVLIMIFLINMFRKTFRNSVLIGMSRKNFILYFSIIIMAFSYANFFAVFRNIEFVVICSVCIAAFVLEYENIVNGVKT